MEWSSRRKHGDMNISFSLNITNSELQWITGKSWYRICDSVTRGGIWIFLCSSLLCALFCRHCNNGARQCLIFNSLALLPLMSLLRHSVLLPLPPPSPSLQLGLSLSLIVIIIPFSHCHKPPGQTFSPFPSVTTPSYVSPSPLAISLLLSPNLSTFPLCLFNSFWKAVLGH